MEGKMVYQVWGTYDKGNSMWLWREVPSFADADSFAKDAASRYPGAEHMVFEGHTEFNRIPLAVWSRHADH
jgi:hypothetical protein